MAYCVLDTICRPVRRGVSRCRSTPPETAGIDFYSGFRKNGQGVQIIVASGQNNQGGVQIEILKKSRYRLSWWLQENSQGGGGSAI